jgi:hypothetical protein
MTSDEEFLTQRGEWSKYAGQGWECGIKGDREGAIKNWTKADEVAIQMWPGEDVQINPELSLLRFLPYQDKVKGIVAAQIPGEDRVYSQRFADTTPESASSDGLKPNRFITSTCIRKFMEDHPMSNMHLMMNTPSDMHNLQVLSTGRCGTISLAHLLQKTQYLTYHQCHFNTSKSTSFQFMCQLIDGNYDDLNIENSWAATRAAEWIGAALQGRPAAFCSHLDTIFAPVFAKIHKKAKFIYLHRDPEKIFNSFASKMQWNNGQLQPILYDFPWRWKLTNHSIDLKLAWYIRFTEEFSRAFGEVMGDQFIEISADKLFAQDDAEIDKLINFTEINLSRGEVADHYAKPINEKVNKIVPIPDGALDAFRSAYDSL